MPNFSRNVTKFFYYFFYSGEKSDKKREQSEYGNTNNIFNFTNKIVLYMKFELKLNPEILF